MPTLPTLPQVNSGRVERLASFPSRQVSARHVDVWLPPGFKPDGSHAVLYMHDGQMLFDAATTWNKQAWNVQDAAAPLIARAAVRPFIVVGVWNSGETRFADYFPTAFLDHLADGTARTTLQQRGLATGSFANAYLRFLLTELKPAIDERFGTARGAADTFIAGSSMGGLISLYALCEYPEKFGGAACLSTHWIGSGERNDVFPNAALAYLDRKLPPPGAHKIYMDRGSTDLDAQYDVAQARVDALMARKGFTAPQFVSRVFEGTGHNERAWAARFDGVLQHLLGR